jgi:hypothetical protein
MVYHHRMFVNLSAMLAKIIEGITTSANIATTPVPIGGGLTRLPNRARKRRGIREASIDLDRVMLDIMSDDPMTHGSYGEDLRGTLKERLSEIIYNHAYETAVGDRNEAKSRRALDHLFALAKRERILPAIEKAWQDGLKDGGGMSESQHLHVESDGVVTKNGDVWTFDVDGKKFKLDKGLRHALRRIDLRHGSGSLPGKTFAKVEKLGLAIRFGTTQAWQQWGDEGVTQITGYLSPIGKKVVDLIMKEYKDLSPSE